MEKMNVEVERVNIGVGNSGIDVRIDEIDIKQALETNKTAITSLFILIVPAFLCKELQSLNIPLHFKIKFSRIWYREKVYFCNLIII